MIETKKDRAKTQIEFGSKKAGKTYGFNRNHDAGRPAQMWFQTSEEGLVLFVVFYTQACRWSRCLGCNLPSMVSDVPVPYFHLMRQVDHLFNDPAVMSKSNEIRKLIVSNNGSVLDEATFSSTALMYLIAKANLHLPNLAVLSMESRPEYVDLEELEFISRALAEGATPTSLEIAIGFEAFDDHIRNDLFDKGLSLEAFEGLVEKMASYGFHLKCYFMQKPVPEMGDERAVQDIQEAIAYLGGICRKSGLVINMHLNPTYAAKGTPLADAFERGRYTPPRLMDVARAALAAECEPLSVFIGLSDEGLAVSGGSFLTPKTGPVEALLESFNQTQNFKILEKIANQS